MGFLSLLNRKKIKCFSAVSEEACANLHDLLSLASFCLWSLLLEELSLIISMEVI